MTQRSWILPLAVLTLAMFAAPLAAQIPLRREFRVAGDADWESPQRSRYVCLAPDGGLNAAWTTSRIPGYDVAARRFDSSGAARAPSFIVNSYTTGFQYGESIASDDAGNFVVVWWGQPTGHEARGQRFDAAGARLGGEFQVDGTSSAFHPFVSMRPTGEFAVVWQSFSTPGIFGRLYDASGVPVSSPFPVNTTGNGVSFPSLDFDGVGNFVVVWQIGSPPSGGPYSSVGRLFNAAGTALGPEFLIATTMNAMQPRVARSTDGTFVVAWRRHDYPDPHIVARRYDPTGAPFGPEFTVGLMRGTNFAQEGWPKLDVDADADGDFVIVWEDAADTFARRFSSTGLAGPQFDVGAAGIRKIKPTVASDPAGNFVVLWRVPMPPPNNLAVDIYGRWFAAGLSAAGLGVDGTATPSSDGNGVFEAGETVTVAPSWLNANFGAETFNGTATSFTGPGTAAYAIVDAAANYGTVASGATVSCLASSDCYALRALGARPAVHWDTALREELAPPNLGGARNWTLHMGDSFGDVARASGFYRFIETLLHRGVTAGCSATQYCPASSTSRAQMTVFALVAKEGPGFVPPACVTPVFNDVPASSPFCPWIEELARRGVVGGCGVGTYCPTTAVSREQMAVIVLRTREQALIPPPCGTPRFNDVPASSPFCPWIEELARRGIVTGCGSGIYCPAAPVTREQMAVFISVTFGLTLYGP